MKALALCLIVSILTLFPTISHALEFSPSFDLGIGLQHVERSGGSSSDYLFGDIKTYLFQQPNKILGFKLLGLGLGINTHGDAQFILSPVSVTILSFLTVAPDYGIGLNNNSPNYWGLSIGIGF